MTVQVFSSPGERAGLALVATAGLASTLFTGALMVYIVRNALVTKNKHSPVPHAVRAFAQSSLGCYLISLLCCDFSQGIAFALNYYWARLGFMSHGTVCTIQGAVSQVGDLGSTIWSLAIALHTFCLLFLTRKPHRLVAPVVLCIGWTVLIVLPIIGALAIRSPERGPFYDPTGAWCWIGQNYGVARVVYLYAWIFATLGASVVAYALIYFRFSNLIIIKDNGKLAINWGRSGKSMVFKASLAQPAAGAGTSQQTDSSVSGCFQWVKDIRNPGTINSGTIMTGNSDDRSSQGHVGDHLKRTARRLMWYPILYAVVVLPPSICRMGVLAGWQPPFGLFVFAGVCFGSSGVTNSILFITTRHSIIKQAASTNTTRVHVTTQRITVREEWTDGGQEVELGDVKFEKGPYLPNSAKKVEFYPSLDSSAENKGKKRVSIIDNGGESGSRTPPEDQANFHVAVLGGR